MLANDDESYPRRKLEEPASSAETVHLASLQLLFLSSVANTAPRWVSRRCRQSMPPLDCACKTHGDLSWLK